MSRNCRVELAAAVVTMLQRRSGFLLLVPRRCWLCVLRCAGYVPGPSRRRRVLLLGS
jgi:hypothetical protein